MSHSVQRDIEEFHRVVVGIPASTTPAIRRPELRAELIREESEETIAAILRGDLIEAIDGLCDILAVTYGAAAEFGIDLAPFWDEVHRSNMAKAGGPLREDGKRLKPEGWTPPDIAGVLSTLRSTSPAIRDELWGEDAEAVRAAVDALFGHHPERGGLEREQAAFAVVQAVKPVLHAQFERGAMLSEKES